MALHGGPSPSPFWQPKTSTQRLLATFYKALFIAGVVHVHVMLTTTLHRSGAFCAAVAFIAIETGWTSFAVEDEKTGSVTLHFPPKKLGHSSFAQFWSNVIFTPLILHFYRSLVSPWWARVLLFPCNIWALEIIEGYILMFLFGRNVAWEYRGSSAFFHGNITLDYLLPWMLLGGAVEAAWEPLLEGAIGAFDEADAAKYLLPVAGIFTLVLAPKMSAVAIFTAITTDKGGEPEKKKSATTKKKAAAASADQSRRRSRSRARSPAKKSPATKKSSQKKPVRSSSRPRARNHSAPLMFSKNDRVEANFKGEGEWYTGKVTKVWPIGTYNIAYDDGDTESHVPEEWLRLESSKKGQ
mmetsp:Transcript_23542/g.46826  ORF Transcript_23542/g.46826 Transcript_23542/m.46826 type:complete len:354 (+) Transcript_23542:56-1117(+)|eukprot:CAMPEP_0182463982 /NCGR_PEP_ID=MMETSP1319-20130603/8148_1 /TAXON_ID=172717 /ORGANISM="Bolidomonas pacifica, Strain RCC208" /LENGTH=353 /DNA_ID=CAMNT_0024663583 /DNA_START=38 /DNA_END=1102 /DNA_ORIENTATION=+